MSSLFPRSINNNNDVHSQRMVRMVYLLLIFATLVVFHRLPTHDFINLDDNLLVYENPQVLAGFTTEGVIWAFTQYHAEYWHPVTWLSHMLDCQVFGLRPGLHHLTSLLFHLANCVLLLLILRKMTGDLWRSAFVAALFAIHPLHVESVAWVAERKDVLSAFFWFLTIWAYVRYAEQPGLRRYLLVLLFFGLGLMAKPMVVTLPFVLLLLDYWPLGRLQLQNVRTVSHIDIPKASVFSLVWEKIPLFALTAVTIIATIAVQGKVGALKSLEAFPLTTRIANALVSCTGYIAKMMWPHNLAVYYPYPGTIPVWQVAGSGLLLLALSVMVIKAAKNRPFLAVGWLWYLGTLVPVLGLVQVGSQAMADRYTYLSLIGLFIMIAWGVPSILAGWRHGRTVSVIASVILLLGCMVGTWRQIGYWRNSITLFQHTLQVTTNNHFAHNNLGVALAQDGRLNEAIKQYSEALRIKPDRAEVHNNLGNALAAQGSVDRAVDHYYQALRIDPNNARAYNNLGNLLANQGKMEEAINHYNKALRLEPNYVGAHYNLGIALAEQGRTEQAIKHVTEALRLMPYWAGAHNNLGVLLERRGRLDEAIDHYQEALRLDPNYAKARTNLERALSLMDKSAEISRTNAKVKRSTIQPPPESSAGLS
ncbi:MAG: tetratricopeptide repeat protein [Deltaproteobacteria bacterium]|nr:tetratricopeptide repeat protein [Deltaproteobacteria bacterium]